MIHIARNGTQLGTFIIEEVNLKLESGEILLTDLAWTEGMANWAPVAEIPGIMPPLRAPAAAPAAPAMPVTPPPIDPFAPPATMQPHAGYPVPLRQETSGTAVASMICGILAVLCSIAQGLGILLGITAVILGHVSRSSIRKSNPRQAGDGMAVTGLITGYIGMAISAAILIFAMWFVTHSEELLNSPEFRKSMEELKTEIEKADKK